MWNTQNILIDRNSIGYIKVLAIDTICVYVMVYILVPKKVFQLYLVILMSLSAREKKYNDYF